MSRIILRSLSVAAALVVLSGAASASGGVVLLKTDNGPDGYYYNANGAESGRYVTVYRPQDTDPGAIICGARIRAIDMSQITPGIDDYTLGVDLRRRDPACPEYADLTTMGLIAFADANSLSSCSTTGLSRTVTFGGGAGVPEPQGGFTLTAVQPANRNPADPSDFCGLLLDTSSAFVNAARTMGVRPGAAPKQSPGANHFLEGFVFEPKPIDLGLRMSGSARFPGDAGLKVVFARRQCTVGVADCRRDSADQSGGTTTTDDFITAHLTIDNNTPSPVLLDLTIEADQSPINPKAGLRDVTALFRPLGGGPPIMNPVGFPVARTIFNLEIRTAFKRSRLRMFPVDPPFIVTLSDPNDSQLVPDAEQDLLGLRPFAGWYDDGSAEAFVVPRIPFTTSDAVATRYAAVDLPRPGNELLIDSVQIVGGEFGGSGLPGIPLIELRTEDPVLVMTPDLSPQGLVRRAIGPFPLGPPPTTIDIDLTDVRSNPPSFAFAPNFWLLAFLSPRAIGRGAGVVGIGADTDTETGVDDNAFTKPGDGGTPVNPDCDSDYLMRLDTDPPAGFPITGPRRGRPGRSFALKAPYHYVIYERNRQED